MPSRPDTKIERMEVRRGLVKQFAEQLVPLLLSQQFEIASETLIQVAEAFKQSLTAAEQDDLGDFELLPAVDLYYLEQILPALPDYDTQEIPVLPPEIAPYAQAYTFLKYAFDKDVDLAMSV